MLSEVKHIWIVNSAFGSPFDRGHICIEFVDDCPEFSYRRTIILANDAQCCGQTWLIIPARSKHQFKPTCCWSLIEYVEFAMLNTFTFILFYFTWGSITNAPNSTLGIRKSSTQWGLNSQLICKTRMQSLNAQMEYTWTPNWMQNRNTRK